MKRMLPGKRTAVFAISLLISFAIFSFVGYAAEETENKIKLDCIGLSKSSVRLTWSTDIPCESYTVYRADESGEFKAIAETSSSVYKDKKLPDGHKYTYKVTGIYQGEEAGSDTQNIYPLKSVSTDVCQSEKDHIAIIWQYPKKEISATDGFYVYRKSSPDGDYEKIGEVSKNGYLYFFDKNYTFEYTDTTVKKTGSVYSYKVVPYKGENKGTGTEIQITVSPYMYLTTAKKKVTVNWTKFTGATEYVLTAEVYKKNAEGNMEYKGIKTLGTFTGNTKKHTFKLNTGKYRYNVYLTAYKEVSGFKSCIGFYTDQSTDDYKALLRNAKTAKQIKNIKVTDVRGEKKTLAWKEELTQAEREILSDFEKLHFQQGMTLSEKIYYVFRWIHYNTDYEYDYSVLSKYGYVESIFIHKKGQCIQYNGAMVKYLTYLGLPARIIKGYRMESVSHYWGEIKLNGKWYCVETGNYGKNGSWSHLCESYDMASGYNICGKIS